MSASDLKAAKQRYKQERKRIKEKEKEMKEQKKKEEKERKKRGKNFVGREISGPTNFSHDTHVGWDLDRGFEVRNIPAEWKRLFMEAGVKKSELQDPETRKAILTAVRQSMYGAPPAPPSGAVPFMSRSQEGPLAAPPPAPPPAPAAPPPPMAPPMFSPRGGAEGAPPPPPPREIGPGFAGQAIWTEDGNWYNAVVDSVTEDGGVKYYSVTFTEYGNQDTVTESELRNADGSPIGGGSGAGSASSAGGGAADLAALLQAKANALKTPDLTDISQQQETNIVDAIQSALTTRRQGMCYSVYGQDAVQEGWSDDDDESWMDF
jgi:hypothetical protein